MTVIDTARIQPGSHVTLHYRLAIAEGADIANTFIDRPATLLIGAGQIAPSLEQILIGMAVGDHSTVRLTPAEGFGERNPELIQKVSLETLRKQSALGDTYVPGDVVEFNAPSGGRYAGVLKEIGDTYALFDFNHPLAGQSLTFEAKVIGIL